MRYFIRKIAIRIALAPLLLAITSRLLISSQTVLQTFTVTESFGVAYQDQIIAFDYPDTSLLDHSKTCVIGPDGTTQVPYQVLSTGKIAVRASLHPHQTLSWQLLAGCAPSAQPYSDQVTLTTRDPYIEVRNGLTGVRVLHSTGQTRSVRIASVVIGSRGALITTATNHDLETINDDNSGNAAPSALGTARLAVTISGVSGACRAINGTHYLLAPDYWSPSHNQVTVEGVTGPACSDKTGGTITVSQTDLAPIQGIQLKDGTWTANGPNKLMTFNTYGKFNNLPLNATSVQTEIVESGPLEIVLKVSYSYIPFAQAVQYTSTTMKRACMKAADGALPPCTLPQQPGYYASTITLQAGQPSILIEDDTNKDFTYSLNVYGSIRPDQGRYSSYSASTAPAFGYEPGKPSVSCTGTTSSGTFHDCYRDFSYTSAVTPATPAMLPWNCGSEANTGWYWMIYNKEATNQNAPIIGAYMGRASRAIGTQYTGVAPYFLPDDGTGTHAAGIQFITVRRSNDNTFSSSSRINWAIFVGNTSDLGSPFQITTIQRQFNLHGGFNLDKVYRYVLDYPDPPSGYGSLFGQSSLAQTLLQELRAPEKQGTSLNSYLSTVDPAERPLIGMIADASGATSHKAVVNASALALDMLDTLVNKAGIYDPTYHYWHGGFIMSQELPVLYGALADPTLSAPDRAATKAILALFSYILWDNDFVPIDSQTNNSMGTANMPIQQNGYRQEFALAIPRHPYMEQVGGTVINSTTAALESRVSPTGASDANPHYTADDVLPTVFNILQLQADNIDIVPNEPRMARLAELVMQFSTPPEVRFGMPISQNNAVSVPRKAVEEGNGSTEGEDTPGVLATAFAPSNPDLSARLLGTWIAQGQPYSQYFDNELLIINRSGAAMDPGLGSDNFPGYMSVLRDGWGTPEEGAVWIWNGDWLFDHRNADQGGVVAYALGAPLSLEWSSFYSPTASASNMMSMVVTDDHYPTRWNQDNQPTSAGGQTSSGWISSSNDLFASFPDSSATNAKMVGTDGLVWERRVFLITPDINLPLVVIQDQFSGANASQGKTMSLNLMATGLVQTPAGPIQPPIRLNTSVDGSENAYPSVSATHLLPAGVNHFQFVGQSWTQHPTKGIDWDLYTVSDEDQQFVIGDWGHVWSPSVEQKQFKFANGKNYSESQYILRVHGNQDFETVLLPYRKGTDRSAVTVQQQNEGNLVIRQGLETVNVGANFYSFEDSTKKIVTSYSNETISIDGIIISGGPTEIAIQGSTAVVNFGGSTGIRTFQIPGSWVSCDASAVGASFDYYYEASHPVSIILNRAGSGIKSCGSAAAPAETTAITSPGSSKPNSLNDPA